MSTMYKCNLCARTVDADKTESSGWRSLMIQVDFVSGSESSQDSLL